MALQKEPKVKKSGKNEKADMSEFTAQSDSIGFKIVEVAHGLWRLLIILAVCKLQKHCKEFEPFIENEMLLNTVTDEEWSCIRLLLSREETFAFTWVSVYTKSVKDLSSVHGCMPQDMPRGPYKTHPYFVTGDIYTLRIGTTIETIVQILEHSLCFTVTIT
ncbi:hypothetical protein TRIUR3_10495 [Triticum urartu]|uniref:Uncharacterized protein n=1 Tax=Triticum urartu TaxID=4572 RepID=M7YPT7_TRIUA|nr:hypothetical protein TRIUR3_10495 [Triticum urartu]